MALKPGPEKAKANVTEAQDAVLARHSAGMIRRYVFPPDTILFEKGDERHCAYLIDSGEVNVYGNDAGGEDKLLCVLGEGEIFGEMALIEPKPRTATALTATQAEIFIIPRQALYERVSGLDPIVSFLMSLLIERYRLTRIHLPESIKQDRKGGFFDKMARHGQIDSPIKLSGIGQQREAALTEIKLEQELRAGLEKREFVPVLQPILNLAENKLAGYEALIRWHHADKGLVMPNDFIPVAERTGVVHNLDRLMLEQACSILPDLHKRAGGAAKDLYISVNLSGINFGSLDVVETVSRVLSEAAINPAHITLEITESALIGDPDLAEEALCGLKKLGVNIALDDFGTGYSSLGYLHKFTIDKLKIDRSFVMQLHDGQKSLDLVKAMISLAHTFDLGVIAEGIEMEKDVDVLKALGCGMGQGYLFGKPLPVDEAYAYADKALGEK